MYGVAWLVEEKLSSQEYVIKVIEKKGVMAKPEIYLKYLEEVNNMKKLDHMNIVKIYHIIEDTKNYYIVMEYVANGDNWRRI